MYPLQKRGEPAEEKRTVVIPETDGLQNFPEDPLRHPGTDHEPAGQIREKGFFYGLQRCKKADRIQLMLDGSGF